MQLLIDTPILIWFLEGNNSLSKSRRQIIANSSNNVFVSIASFWEMAIKISVVNERLPIRLLMLLSKLRLKTMRFYQSRPNTLCKFQLYPFITAIRLTELLLLNRKLKLYR